MRRSYTVLFIAVLLPLLLEPIGRLLGSGNGFNSAVLVRTFHPDEPLENFLRGKLGVVEPTYWRWDLVIAYRSLSGQPLTPQEREALRSYWDEEARAARYSLGAGATPQPPDANAAMMAWLNGRDRVPGVQPGSQVLVYREGTAGETGYYAYLNCPADAFLNAARTLTKRIERFGASDPEVREWVGAQDQVFANCGASGGWPRLKPNWTPPGQPSQTPEGGMIPATTPASASPVFKADRAYQIAAANFYAGNFDVAEKQFAEIAGDASSTWRVLAPYLAVRCLVRKGTLAKPMGFEAAPLHEAEARLQRMENDPACAGIHSAVEGLLNFVEWRLHPEGALRPVAQKLAKPGASHDYYQDLTDYTLMLNKRQESGGPVDAALREDDLTDWVLTFNSPGADAGQHALERWRSRHSLTWLVAAISGVVPTDPASTELRAAAQRVPRASPAYLTVTYHRLRLELAAGRQEELRTELAKLLASRDWQGQPSALNLFRAQALPLARSYDEFLSLAPRAVAGYAYSAMPAGYSLDVFYSPDTPFPSGAEQKTLFDVDSARVFSFALPLSMLTQAATGKTLPAHLRRRWALAAWTRAFLLGDEPAALKLVPTLHELAPELKPYLEPYAAAANSQARRYDGLWMLLKSPGLQPFVEAGTGRLDSLVERDRLRDNWWCVVDPRMGLDLPASWGMPQRQSPNPPAPPAPAAPFLSTSQQAAARAELARLETAGVATDFLSCQVLDWAKQQPEDPRIPEALSLVVILPHAGCTEDQTGRFSHAAYDLLHSRYGSTSWAKQTRYWYK